jgi:hypothetical protein
VEHQALEYKQKNGCQRYEATRIYTSSNDGDGDNDDDDDDDGDDVFT